MRLHRCASLRRTRLDMTFQHTDNSHISRMIPGLRGQAMTFILYSNRLASARNDSLTNDTFMEKLCSCFLCDGHIAYVTDIVQRACFKFSYETIRVGKVHSQGEHLFVGTHLCFPRTYTLMDFEHLFHLANAHNPSMLRCTSHIVPETANELGPKDSTACHRRRCGF
jgi:hypothetical protein